MELFVSGRMFEGYLIRKVMSNSYDYRTVYDVECENRESGVLVVYDMEAYRGSVYELEDIAVPAEFYFVMGLQKKLAPEVYNLGVSVRRGNLCWMCMKRIIGMPLDLYMVMNVEKDRHFFVLLLKKLCNRLRWLWEVFPGCAHFNLTLDNIYISGEEDGEPYVIGWHHADRGDTRVRRQLANNDGLQYKSPEMLTGNCSLSCDVYAMAAIACFIVGGHMPWDLSLWHQKPTMTESKRLLAKLRRCEYDLSELPECMAKVIRKGLACKTRRYPNLQSFCLDLDYAMLNMMKELVDSRSSNVEDADSISDTDEEELDSFFSKENDGRPETHVKMGRTAGGGFDLVAGMEELKSNLTRNYINVLRNPSMAESYGIRPPNGMLLYGPPGCGKSYIAARLAEEVGLKVSFVRPSDLGSIYIHGSETMIADLFKKAEENAPSLLVFDEIDALVPSRSTLGGNAALSGEVNEFLTQLDGCSRRGIFVVGTTNRIEQIDPAVLRTGRLEELVYVPLPDDDNRRALFALELKGKPCHKDVDLDRLVALTEGFTMSDVSYVVKKACRMAFDKAMNEGKGRQWPIDMALLMKAIGETIPSVDLKAEKEYERQHQSYNGRKHDQKTMGRRIGFAVN